MNILVIGNGFDLAHGLQTKYEHFFKFIEEYKKYQYIFTSEEMVSDTINEAPKGDIAYILFFLKLFINRRDIFIELNDLIVDNIWLKYLKKNLELNGWIDIEREISKFVKLMDEARIITSLQIRERKKNRNKIRNIMKIILDVFDMPSGKLNADLVIKCKKIMLDDLNRITRCLEIYVETYVKYYMPLKKIKEIEKLDIDKILSFNYTNTYEKIYNADNKKNIEYDFIHGKADINNDIDSCNLVLGIDEYLPDSTKDTDNEFIEFKKFYQRIHKQTGCKYKDWINEMEDNNQERVEHIKSIKKTRKEQFVIKHNLYIFGHSLDITDGDVLQSLILNDNVYTTIYYVNRKMLGELIRNLVKVIGQDELIKRTGGETKTIEFKQQEEAIESR